jgi:hypothetical protein
LHGPVNEKAPDLPGLVEGFDLKAEGEIRTHNPRFTKAVLCH